MSLSETINPRYQAIMSRFQSMYEDAQLFQKQVMEYAKRQDELNAKITNVDNQLQALIDENRTPAWNLNKRLEVRQKFFSLYDIIIPLQVELMEKSMPHINSIYEYIPTVRSDLKKINPAKITADEAISILTNLETKIDELEAGLKLVQQRLINCQNLYAELQALHNSTLN